MISGFGLEINKRLTPNEGRLIVLIDQTDAALVLPENLAHEQIVADQFQLNFLFLLDKILNLTHAGQTSIEFRHSLICTTAKIVVQLDKFSLPF